MSQRTNEQINQEYSNLAIQVGHKRRILKDLLDELESDERMLQELNREGLKVKASLAAVEAAPTESA